MDEPLVSVIIPVYNVKKYLRQCLDSVTGQTYKNIEIILVDDGSTDDSGRICDYYANADSRIKVIHKENGGLSDARNIGIEQSNGIYINFVDSDDYICKNCIEVLLSTAICQSVPLVVCGYKKFIDGKNNHKEISDESQFKNNSIHKYTAKEAMIHMLYNKNIPMYAHGKLYDRKLFKTLRFPKGKLFEDVPTTWKVMKEVDNIVYVDSILYFYRQRIESIVNAHYSHRKMDQIYMVKDIMDEVMANDKLYKAAVSKYYFCLADLYAQIDEKHKSDQIYLEHELKRYRNIVKDDRNNSLSLRMLAVLGINLPLMRTIGRIYKHYKKLFV